MTRGLEASILDYMDDVIPVEKSVNFTKKINTEPISIKKKVRKAKGLVIFQEEDMRDMVPCFLDKDMLGDFYIACGNIVSMRSYDEKTDVVIGCGNEKLSFTVTENDSFYKKVKSASGGFRIVVLMNNSDNHCVDMKLGPFFGMIGWRCKQRNSSGRVVTDFFVKA